MRSTILPRDVVTLVIFGAAVAAISSDAEGIAGRVPAIGTNEPYATAAGVLAQFTGAATVGPLTSAAWSFSDGTSVAGLMVATAFAAPGIYTAALSVTWTRASLRS